MTTSNQPSDLSAFLSVYQVTMRRRQLTDFRDVVSLVSILSELGGEGKTKLFLATDKGTVIAGVLLLLHKQNAQAWLRASNPNWWHLRPNELLVWTAIEWRPNPDITI